MLNSGTLVPNATRVDAITTSGIPIFTANTSAALTKPDELIAINAAATIIKMKIISNESLTLSSIADPLYLYCFSLDIQERIHKQESILEIRLPSIEESPHSLLVSYMQK